MNSSWRKMISATRAMPKIHGWAYDVETGLLQKLKIDFKVRLRCLRVLCNNFCCGVLISACRLVASLDE